MMPAPDMRTLRFWAYVNDGWVKLSINPGDTIRHVVGGPTDEGWSSECVEWTHDGERVLRDSYTDGRDCDGRLSTEHHCFANAGALAARQWDGIASPDWQPVSAGQRDYAAEAAGY